MLLCKNDKNKNPSCMRPTTPELSVSESPAIPNVPCFLGRSNDIFFLLLIKVTRDLQAYMNLMMLCLPLTNHL